MTGKGNEREAKTVGKKEAQRLEKRWKDINLYNLAVLPISSHSFTFLASYLLISTVNQL